MRDFIHINDLARGHIDAINLVSQVNDFIPKINLGTGVGYSVLQIINIFEKVSGEEIPYKVHDRRKGDIAVSLADVDLAKKLLSWESCHDLEEMCEDTWNWYKRRSKD